MLAEHRIARPERADDLVSDARGDERRVVARLHSERVDRERERARRLVHDPAVGVLGLAEPQGVAGDHDGFVEARRAVPSSCGSPDRRIPPEPRRGSAGGAAYRSTGSVRRATGEPGSVPRHPTATRGTPRRPRTGREPPRPNAAGTRSGVGSPLPGYCGSAAHPRTGRVVERTGRERGFHEGARDVDLDGRAVRDRGRAPASPGPRPRRPCARTPPTSRCRRSGPSAITDSPWRRTGSGSSSCTLTRRCGPGVSFARRAASTPTKSFSSFTTCPSPAVNGSSVGPTSWPTWTKAFSIRSESSAW